VKIKERNKRLESKNNMMIEMDPDIAAAFTQSQQVSSKSEALPA